MESNNDLNAKPGAEQTNAPGVTVGPSSEVRGIAPVWHTVILIAVIVGVSLMGVHRHSGGQGIGAGNRLRTYGTTGGLELALVGWVALGLKLRKIPVRSLIGRASNSFRSIAIDAGIAILFWIGSMMALATIAMMWISIESLITHKPIPIQTTRNGQPTLPKTPETQAERAVVQLAPTNGKEIASWLALCVLVGFAEELVFRGYFQSQFIAWGRGAAWAGVVFSALMFGAAHGYEGVRAMFLLSIFGAFFSVLALFRRSLRAGMFAHTWHDAFAGLMVAFLHSHHFL